MRVEIWILSESLLSVLHSLNVITDLINAIQYKGSDIKVLHFTHPHELTHPLDTCNKWRFFFISNSILYHQYRSHHHRH